MGEYGDFEGLENMKKEIKKLNYAQLQTLKFYVEREMEVQASQDRIKNIILRGDRIARNKERSLK